MLLKRQENKVILEWRKSPYLFLLENTWSFHIFPLNKHRNDMRTATKRRISCPYVTPKHQIPWIILLSPCFYAPFVWCECHPVRRSHALSLSERAETGNKPTNHAILQTLENSASWISFKTVITTKFPGGGVEGWWYRWFLAFISPPVSLLCCSLTLIGSYPC